MFGCYCIWVAGFFFFTLFVFFFFVVNLVWAVLLGSSRFGRCISTTSTFFFEGLVTKGVDFSGSYEERNTYLGGSGIGCYLSST
jgi:hypothetical protein